MEAVTMERGTLRKVEVDEPIPKKGEVLVKSIACGICGRPARSETYRGFRKN